MEQSITITTILLFKILVLVSHILEVMESNLHAFWSRILNFVVCLDFTQATFFELVRVI